MFSIIKILIYTLSITVTSCANTTASTEIFKESVHYFDKSSLKGSSFFVMKHVSGQENNPLIDKLKLGAEEYFRGIGFKLVSNPIDANLLILVGYYEEHQVLKRDFHKVRRYYVSGVEQKYSQRAVKKFDVLSSHFTIHNPKKSHLEESINNLIANLGKVSLTLEEEAFRGRPGCTPVFGFSVDSSNSIITKISSDGSFQQAGIHTGFKIEKMNGHNYSEYVPGINDEKFYTGMSEIEFIFIDNGKVIKRKISPKLNCIEWPKVKEQRST